LIVNVSDTIACHVAVYGLFISRHTKLAVRHTTALIKQQRVLFTAAFWVLAPRTGQTASLQKQNGANTITIVGREPLNIEIHCCPPLGLLFYFSRFSFSESFI
jgi:hypothetical protein